LQKSIVSIAKGVQAQPMVEEAINLLGGVEKLIKPGSTVVLKPNAGHLYGPQTSVNTSPEMVKAVIKVIRQAKPKKIILAESASIGADTFECLKVSGIQQAAEEAGVDSIIDIKREKDLLYIPIRDARTALTRVLLPRFLLEADHVINLPIFKSHVSMVFTCALKNIKGLVQDKVHHEMHRTNLTDSIIDLWSVARADLTIADMIRPAEGFGPHCTLPVDFGCVVAGQDPVAVDATICRMVGLGVSKIKYFQSTAERRFGYYDTKHIEIRGKSIKEVYKKLWLPYIGGFDQWPEYHIYAENACSSCQGLLAYTMEWLKALGEYDKHAGTNIVVGSKREMPPGLDPEKTILVGDCNKKFRGQGYFAQGCPPAEPYILFSMLEKRDYLEDDENTRPKYDKMVAQFLNFVVNKRKESQNK
jgi:uncharacterized protein (DUF362 family)